MPFETKLKEFKKFHKKLMKATPESYIPWYFPVQKNNKAPDVPRGVSWKGKEALLTFEQAFTRLKKNKGNVGISGRKNDPLILVDIDDKSIEPELKPTLKIRSRSRVGTHAIYISDPKDKKLPCNIPTEKGEVRSSEQYVVAPGSYVPCTKKEIDKKVKKGDLTKKDKKKILNDKNRGFYTVDNNKDISTIKFKELPKVFRETVKENERKTKEIKERKKQRKEFSPKKANGNHSALFDLEITDVVPSYSYNKRSPHPLHSSDTGKNFSLGKGVAHCWRHLVSLNAIQFLVAESGYMTCREAGTGHKNAQGRMDAGPSYIIGDNGAIFHAWLQAKKNGQIPKNDPVPVRGLYYIAKKHKICNDPPDISEYPEKKLNDTAYNKTLKIIEEEY